MTAKKYKIDLHVLGVFFFAFLFIMVCYVGLPIDFNADYVRTHVRGLTFLSTEELVRNILNPTTPAWFYPEDGRMEYLRPLQVLIFNFIHYLFPFNMVPFQILAGIGNGLLGVFFYLFIFYWTRKPILGWLAVIFYCSFPTNYFIMSSVSPIDFQFFISAMSALALVIFALLTMGQFKKRLSFVAAILLSIILIWLGIKLKSTEKILPFVCLTFFLRRSPFILKRIGRFRFSVIFITMLATMILVVPLKSFEAWTEQDSLMKDNTSTITVTPTTKKDKQTFSFQWRNLVQRTFYVTGGEFPFTTPYRNKTPRSFTENWGMFLSWPFWISIVLTPLTLLRMKSTEDGVNPLRTEPFRHFYFLFLTWFCATIAGFANGADLTEIRLLNFAYVPAVFLFFVSVAFLFDQLIDNEKIKKLTMAILIVAVIMTSSNNYALLLELIGHFGGMQDNIVKAETETYRSFFKEEPKGVALYDHHQELEDRVVFVDWYVHSENWRDQIDEKLKNEGIVYFYTRTPDSERLRALEKLGYHVALWKRFDFLNSNPFIFRMFRVTALLNQAIRKKVRGNEMLVYLVTSPSQAGS